MMESSKHHFSGGELGGMTSVTYFPFCQVKKRHPKNHQGIQGRDTFYPRSLEVTNNLGNGQR